MATDTSGLEAGVREWAARVAEAALVDFSVVLQEAAPLGEGTLRGSLELDGPHDTGGEQVGSVAFPVDHASYTDEGTDPHEIVGNPLLAFEWNGATVIVHSVQHPGTRGTGWWTDNATDDGWAAACERAADGVEVEV